jgi:tetratricopeptide (TPR) repeat protein
MHPTFVIAGRDPAIHAAAKLAQLLWDGRFFLPMPHGPGFRRLRRSAAITRWMKIGDPRRALEDLNKVIELEPTPISFFSRGLVYRHLGEYEKALQDYNHGDAVWLLIGSPIWWFP